MKIKIKIFICLLIAFSFVLLSGCKEKSAVKEAVTDIKEVTISTSLIAEITSLQAETFDGESIDDVSKPFNSYLPAGTVDYCSDAVITHVASDKDFRLLRYGKRVYNGDLKVYEGSLPSSNTIIPYGIESDGKYTSFYFETDFKAPFTLELKEQEYQNENANNFKVTGQTFSFVEITFAYCSSLLEDFDLSYNKLFSHYELIQNEDNAVLRLYLKEKGAFYGWFAEYDEDDFLVFRFLEPTKVYVATNEYGYALHDATIVIDAGHGGKDPGAMNGNYSEAGANLALANKLKEELEHIGVNVIMTRTDNSDITAAQRYITAFNAKADMVISIHRDSGSGNGFNAYYFNPYTFDLSSEITKAVNNTNLYSTVHKENWHYFFLSRISCCPSVLTENGFISDKDDLNNMLNSDHQTECAKAITAGIIRFYINSPLY